MANFAVIDRTPARLVGDFQIEPLAPHVPTIDQKEFLTQIHAELDRLARDAATDGAAELRDRLRAARRDLRSAVVAKLRVEATEFAADAKTTSQVQGRVKEIMVEYGTSIPDVVIERRKTDRFSGDFAVRCVGFMPDADELAYLDRLEQFLDYLYRDEISDPKANLSDAILLARREQRKATADELKKDAEYWREGLRSEVAANNVLVLRGGYKALRDRLMHSLFTIKVLLGEGEERGVAIDLDIRLERDLPAPNDLPSPEKQDLFVQLDSANAIIRTVCQRIRDRAESPYRKRTNSVDVDAVKRARRLLDEYINKLAGIGRLGLEGPYTSLAKLALTSLKHEFVARESGLIKNRYVKRLGSWAGGFALAFLAFYGFLAGDCLPEFTGVKCSAWWVNHKMFLLAAVGASVGTWVSFSVRRIDLPFEELALVEEEALDPPFRILFVVTLTLTVCLLFWTSAINIEIGNLKTGPSSFRATGSVAVLIGMFCGLSERALATAISGRAAAFVKGVGGGG